MVAGKSGATLATVVDAQARTGSKTPGLRATLCSAEGEVANQKHYLVLTDSGGRSMLFMDYSKIRKPDGSYDISSGLAPDLRDDRLASAAWSATAWVRDSLPDGTEVWREPRADTLEAAALKAARGMEPAAEDLP